jgi:uncharacterized protein (DUF58 family)
MNGAAKVKRSGLRFAVTKLGWLLIFIAIVLFLSSITSQSSLLLVPIGILTGCFLINIFSSRQAVRSLELVAPELIRAVEKQTPDRSWLARNHAAQPIGGITVSTGNALLFNLHHIDPASETHPVPAKTYARRGVYEHEATVVSTRFPFGLTQVYQTLHLAGQTIVHPDIYHVGTPQAAGFDVMVGGKFRGQRQAASGDSFSGVREHRPGDSLRQIHWPSSAKGHGLMVKNFDEELSGRVGIILDAGSSGDTTVLDNAIRLAGSLAYSALDEGHHVELINLADLHPELIPPFDDGQGMLDGLAALPTSPNCLSPESLGQAVDQLSRKTALHFVLTAQPAGVPDFLAELVASGRKVTVYQPHELPPLTPSVERFDESGLAAHV